MSQCKLLVALVFVQACSALGPKDEVLGDPSCELTGRFLLSTPDVQTGSCPVYLRYERTLNIQATAAARQFSVSYGGLELIGDQGPGCTLETRPDARSLDGLETQTVLSARQSGEETMLEVEFSRPGLAEPACALRFVQKLERQTTPFAGLLTGEPCDAEAACPSAQCSFEQQKGCLFNVCAFDERDATSARYCTEACTENSCPTGFECVDFGEGDFYSNEAAAYCLRLPSICGDGQVGYGEVCDDGNTNDQDGCAANCASFELCGDGFKNIGAGENCDDGNGVSGDGCSPFCRAEECGNYQLDVGEDCDDGNTHGGDGCDEGCHLESCGDGDVFGVENCDDGDALNTNGCTNTCRLSFTEERALLTPGFERSVPDGVPSGISEPKVINSLGGSLWLWTESYSPAGPYGNPEESYVSFLVDGDNAFWHTQYLSLFSGMRIMSAWQDGAAVVLWLFDGTEILESRSYDGGQQFSLPVALAMGGLPVMSTSGHLAKVYSRDSGKKVAFLALRDASQTPAVRRLYSSVSSDGMNWSQAQILSSGSAGDSASLPVVELVGESMTVVFGDGALDGGGLFARRSEDGGESFSVLHNLGPHAELRGDYTLASVFEGEIAWRASLGLSLAHDRNGDGSFEHTVLAGAEDIDGFDVIFGGDSEGGHRMYWLDGERILSRRRAFGSEVYGEVKRSEPLGLELGPADRLRALANPGIGSEFTAFLQVAVSEGEAQWSVLFDAQSDGNISVAKVSPSIQSGSVNRVRPQALRLGGKKWLLSSPVLSSIVVERLELD